MALLFPLIYLEFWTAGLLKDYIYYRLDFTSKLYYLDESLHGVKRQQSSFGFIDPIKILIVIQVYNSYY